MKINCNSKFVGDNNTKWGSIELNRPKLRPVFGWLILLMLVPVALPAQHSEALQLSLSDALNEALTVNPRIGAVRMEVRQAEAAVRVARSSLLPDLVMIGEYSSYEEPALVSPMHGTPTPADPLDFDRDIYTGILRLDVPILDLASLSGVGVAQQMVEAGRAQTSVVEQGVMAGIIELYVQMGQLSDNLTLLDSHVAALTRRHEELMILKREGRVPQASVSQLAASLDSAMSDRLELVHRQEVVAYRLAEQLGRNEPVYPRVHDFSVSDINKENLSYGAVPMGPQGLAAEAQYNAAQKAQSAARSTFAPRISGFASQTLRASPDTDIYNDWALGLSVSLPILSGGERAARLKSAEARLNAARYERDTMRISEQSEAQIAHTRSLNAALRREYLANAVQNQVLTVTAEENRYIEGRSSLSDFLTEETVLLGLRMQERSMLYEELLAYVSYYKIMGELSPSLVNIFIEE